MDKNAIDFLIDTLDKIDATIKNLENSPNRAFIMIDTKTLSLFHWFNWCFKLFWREKFDRKSASQLLFYKKIIKIHSELSGRYTSLFHEHIDYLKNVLTINKESSQKFNPVFFGEEKNKDIINYYEEQLKSELDTEGKPLYKIDVENNIYFEDYENKTQPSDFYIFRSDSINNTHVKAFLGLYYCLKNVFNLMSVVCSYPEEIISGYKPSQEEIITALENEARQYAKEIGSSVHRELKKIFLEQKRSNNNSQSSDIWAQVLEVESEAFRLAISGKLVGNKERIFDHYDEDKRRQWTDNYKLLQKIKDTCIDDEIFDVRLAVETYHLLSVLSADNLDLFYELVLRRNIIQCEMYSELKPKYNKWLTPPDDKAEKHDIPQTQVDNEVGVIMEEPAEEERFHFIHVEIEDEEAWRIHRAIKRLVANYGIPEICKYLKEQKKIGKLMLPSDLSAIYNELVRLGMPKGKGFSENHFKNSYTK